jgi:hypothetical protein
MKNFVILIIAISYTFMIYQCQNKVSDNDLTHNQNLNSLKKTFIDKLSEKGIFVSNNEEGIQMRNDACYHYENTDSCEFVGTVSDTISLNTLCDSIPVTYKLYWCPQLGKLTFTDFQMKVNGINCPKILNWWYKLYSQGKYTELSLAVDSLEHFVSIEAEDNVSVAFAFAFGYFCPDDIIHTYYYSSRCYKHCLKYIGGKKYPKFEIFKVYCGTLCCARDRNLCVKDDGSVDPSNMEFRIVWDNCSQSASSTECQGGYLIGPCYRECGPPQ